MKRERLCPTDVWQAQHSFDRTSCRRKTLILKGRVAVVPTLPLPPTVDPAQWLSASLAWAAVIAQLGERKTEDLKVSGSIPDCGKPFVLVREGRQTDRFHTDWLHNHQADITYTETFHMTDVSTYHVEMHKRRYRLLKPKRRVCVGLPKKWEKGKRKKIKKGTSLLAGTFLNLLCMVTWFKCLCLYCAIFGCNLDRPADNVEGVKMQEYFCRILINFFQDIEVLK